MIRLTDLLNEGIMHEAGYSDEEKAQMGIPPDAESRGGRWYIGDEYIGYVDSNTNKFVDVRTQQGTGTEQPQAQPSQDKQKPTIDPTATGSESHEKLIAGSKKVFSGIETQAVNAFKAAPLEDWDEIEADLQHQLTDQFLEAFDLSDPEQMKIGLSMVTHIPWENFPDREFLEQNVDALRDQFTADTYDAVSNAVVSGQNEVYSAEHSPEVKRKKEAERKEAERMAAEEKPKPEDTRPEWQKRSQEFFDSKVMAEPDTKKAAEQLGGFIQNIVDSDMEHDPSYYNSESRIAQLATKVADEIYDLYFDADESTDDEYAHMYDIARHMSGKSTEEKYDPSTVDFRKFTEVLEKGIADALWDYFDPQYDPTDDYNREDDWDLREWISTNRPIL